MQEILNRSLLLERMVTLPKQRKGKHNCSNHNLHVPFLNLAQICDWFVIDAYCNLYSLTAFAPVMVVIKGKSQPILHFKTPAIQIPGNINVIIWDIRATKSLIYFVSSKLLIPSDANHWLVCKSCRKRRENIFPIRTREVRCSPAKTNRRCSSCLAFCSSAARMACRKAE